MTAALARRGTILAGKRVKRTPASLALEEAMRAAKPGRFKVAKVEARTVDGKVFDSAKEASYYATLKLRERLGEISDLQTQVALSAHLNEHLLCTLTVDFKYFEVERAVFILAEVKSDGTEKDPYYRLRRKAVELYHGIKIQEVVL